MKFFKVRNMSTGRFSSGGFRPRWSKKGKIWFHLGHVKIHVKRAKNMGIDTTLWEILEFEAIQTGAFPASTLTSPTRP